MLARRWGRGVASVSLRGMGDVTRAADLAVSATTSGGVDEAGRGCVLGPLCVAGVVLDPETQSHLLQEGVRDSKLVSAASRERLAELIQANASRYHIVHATGYQIDSMVKSGMNLNEIEFAMAADVCRVLSEETRHIVLDSFDCRPSRLASRMRLCLVEHLGDAAPKVDAAFRADAEHVVAAAASILAKHHREQLWLQEQQAHGEAMGSGYPSDPKTVAWMRAYFASEAHRDDPPPFVRAFFSTSKRLGIAFPRVDHGPRSIAGATLAQNKAAQSAAIEKDATWAVLTSRSRSDAAGT